LTSWLVAATVLISETSRIVPVPARFRRFRYLFVALLMAR
jgi:hypothetical protein